MAKTKNAPSNRTIFRGITAFPGKFYGRCLKVIPKKSGIIHGTYIHDSEKKSQLDLFQSALESVRKDLRQLLRSKETEIREVLEPQLAILDDPILTNGIPERIRNLNESAPLALQNQLNDISEKFSQIPDEYFRERVDHFQDVIHRIQDKLNRKKKDSLPFSRLKEDIILIAKELTPSQMILMDRSHIRGIATDFGGKTGHMAILARNFGIPTVVGLQDAYSQIRPKEFLFLDAENGYLIKNPTFEEIKFYGSSEIYPNPKQKRDKKKHKLKTQDGVRIVLKCNLETDSDSEMQSCSDSEGIGLFRSESLFLKYSDKNVSSEEQFQSYKRIAEALSPLPVTIRTFDIGADKFDSGFQEDNPFLGVRGIRYALQNVDWFLDQIQAILRASAYGNIQILLPMVTDLDEVRETKKLIYRCRKDLESQGIQTPSKIKIGIMIETPAVASSLDQFASECDFFSLGTNDLLQYTMAVDRNNVQLAHLYNPYHIAFLRLLKYSIATALEHKKSIGICGELASDPGFATFLIGLGIRELSVSAPFLPKIQSIVQSIDIHHAVELAEKIMELSFERKYDQIESYLFSRHLTDSR